jgi:outer membrane protein assembly factor BamB
MRKRALLIAAVATFCAFAADWLTEGGDPSRSNWQKREKTLTAENVKEVKLLWKQQFEDHGLTEPVILGPIITHRGIKELVFVEGASNSIYAIDADLGRMFWTRRMEVAVTAQDPNCPFVPPTPVIRPEDVPTEEDDEGHTPVRPMYFAASDHMLHQISPSTGSDMRAPRKMAAGGCETSPLQIAPFAPVGTATFQWKGRTVAIAGDNQGLVLKAGAAVAKLTSALQGLATWEDPAGVRWIYSATAEGVQAWKFNGTALAASWSAPGVGAPVIANGMLFGLSTSGERRVHALDALTGKELYVSESVGNMERASGLAIANGHICFTSANVLYCFGLPMEIY